MRPDLIQYIYGLILSGFQLFHQSFAALKIVFLANHLQMAFEGNMVPNI